MTVRIYLEGAGNKDLDIQCRRAFHTFFARAGLGGKLPQVRPCGGRKEAYDAFCAAWRRQEPGTLVLLLVDSEAPCMSDSPWEHVKNRPGDGWQPPRGVGEEHLFLMVQCMESWFLADRQALNDFFGDGFRDNALPDHAVLEEIGKDAVIRGLARASKASRKGEYDKGNHSFRLMEMIDPGKVESALPSAGRLFSRLRG